MLPALQLGRHRFGRRAFHCLNPSSWFCPYSISIRRSSLRSHFWLIGRRRRKTKNRTPAKTTALPVTTSPSTKIKHPLCDLFMTVSPVLTREGGCGERKPQRH